MRERLSPNDELKAEIDLVVDRILARCTTNPPASDETINLVQQNLGIELPESFRALMMRSNGLEGFPSNRQYLMLYPIDQLQELNEAYCAAEFVPGLLLFGSNGGGEAFALDTQTMPMAEINFPFIGSNPEDATRIGDSFEDFLEYVTTDQHHSSIGTIRGKQLDCISQIADHVQPSSMGTDTNMNPSILDDSVYDQICSECKAGDDLSVNEDRSSAISRYQEAWKLLPEPRLDWDAATWIQTAIGESHFQSGGFDEAIGAYNVALKCPDGLGNPYIHLRLGESYFERGDRALALDNLTRAYMGAGTGIFENEDPKYLAAITEVLLPLEGNETL